MNLFYFKNNETSRNLCISTRKNAEKIYTIFKIKYTILDI